MSGFYTSADRILLALSGGVDSAVAAKILQEQGFIVEGVVMCFSAAHEKTVQAARKSAQELGIHLHIVDSTDLFEKEVIKPFCESYAAGITPNPCILCNPNVKFELLVQEAERLAIPYIATGHYARIELVDGVYSVAMASSAKRDQSYMLYRLPQYILSRLCLPLGDFDKPAVREMAIEYNLSCANSPDSQEICFIPDNDYPAYIEKHGIVGKKGNFISPDGTNLGPHKGVVHYTIGQRKGLGLPLGKPVFVKKIQENGDILLGWSGEEYSSAVELENCVAPNGLSSLEDSPCLVKIRSAASPVPCKITQVEENRCRVVFEQPQRAAAPGQSAVFYHNGLVLGGGFIREVLE